MNLYLATSKYNHHDMVAKFPEGVDPSNPASISQITLFQYGNFNITPGDTQLPKGNLSQQVQTNTLVIYRVNDIHLEKYDDMGHLIPSDCTQGGGVMRFNKTPIQAYAIDQNGIFSPITIPNE